jgi:hypothetical protein
MRVHVSTHHDTRYVHVSTHHDTHYVHVVTHYDTVSKRDRTSCVTQLVSTHVSVACHIDMGLYGLVLLDRTSLVQEF